MAKRGGQNKRSASRLFILGCMIMFFAVICVNMYSQVETYYNLKAEEKELLSQIDDEKKENLELSASKDCYTSDAYIEKVAREQLGLIMPDEIEFVNTADS